ncbi:SDR family oxidoreductase [Desulfovibrio ferrophilus]|uniref:NAD-dependent epimerase/dehydratase n=1 Tax=Desulfovibrio ferrophilus TaxID=241368 RepID=A0A2Z6B216_9BACT|nr:SDR family oxidoreductase [Desulfovibrio ferrophilus]BBD09446.1 NAD-dependent epimerase/dehydratase [Desulfovibrio ferrophilus]
MSDSVSTTRSDAQAHTRVDPDREVQSGPACEKGLVAVLGATGYVGGRLVPTLLEKGWNVRAVGRSATKLHCRSWGHHENLEITKADVMDKASLVAALKGCKSAYYLIHSMVSKNSDYAEQDRQAASNMVEAATEAGVERIIYLGGITPKDPNLSEHLRSRAEVADILHDGPVPVTVLRAAVILGSGSASFELLRYLVDRLPVMLTPKWVRTESQPISIRDVLGYLAGCLDHPATIGQDYDIGGPFIETYEKLFQMYAEEAGLRKRLIIPVPILTPWLSSHWLGLVSPIPVSLAKPLIMGLRNRAVCRDYRIREIMPRELVDCRTAIRRALEKVEQHVVDTSWSDAGALTPPEWAVQGDASYAGGTVLSDSYRVRLEGCPEELWDRVSSIGGDTGWYYGNRLWKLRGWLDSIVGGVGLRRGRRDPKTIAVGDALDFWRVLDVEPPDRLLLLAEMKLPGEALLEFALAQLGTGHTELTVTAKFLPRGVAGLLYWWAVYPLHGLVFRGMIANIASKTHCTILEGPKPVPPQAVKCRLEPPENGS